MPRHLRLCRLRARACSVGTGVMPRAVNCPPCINKSLCNVKCSLCPLGASRTSPPTDGGLTLSISIAKMQLMQAACQKPAQIPLRHNTGDSPAVSCPADTTQGDSPRYHGLRLGPMGRGGAHITYNIIFEKFFLFSHKLFGLLFTNAKIYAIL